ncbi:hypothetical protein YC2023_018942 [Brassica napus]
MRHRRLMEELAVVGREQSRLELICKKSSPSLEKICLKSSLLSKMCMKPLRSTLICYKSALSAMKISYNLFLNQVALEFQLECPPLGSSLGHCEIYMWAAAPETEDRYTVSHMVTPWQRPCSLRSLVWTTSVGPGYSCISFDTLSGSKEYYPLDEFVYHSFFVDLFEVHHDIKVLSNFKAHKREISSTHMLVKAHGCITRTRFLLTTVRKHFVAFKMAGKMLKVSNVSCHMGPKSVQCKRDFQRLGQLPNFLHFYKTSRDDFRRNTSQLSVEVFPLLLEVFSMSVAVCVVSFAIDN